ncbi:MAG: stage II sporulation protein D [Oscillospiraceae bacterium]|jgi:stage II sporulation protein D|nr:stage II sporulation protein D [Oscillospiraceae bacterium]
MKKIALFSLTLGIFAAALSIVSALIFPMEGVSAARDAPIEQEQESPSAPPEPETSLPPPGENDARVNVRVKDGDSVSEMSMFEYLVGAVAGEMPASFEPEALRAQSAAARTYVWYNISAAEPKKHADADVCTDPGCCAAFTSETELREKWGADFGKNLAKIRAAVAATDGIYITYDSEPILAAFHASSYGSTENAEDVWSGARPYLVSVPTPETSEDAPGLISAATISLKDFKETALKALPDTVFGADAEKWITDVAYDEAGRAASMKIGGAEITGARLRELFGLRSTAITVYVSSPDENTGDVIFTTAGHGHGVGMSQYGANIMAKNGADWREIIKTYYTGAIPSDEIFTEGIAL